jgi:tetratricopeptide (TPR) repeat protein
LETIRRYALEKLNDSGGMQQVRQRHRDFFIEFAKQAEPKLKGAQQIEWLDRLEVEHDNLRTALQWTQETGDLETTLQLAGLLFWFWYRHSYLIEGRDWLERALAATKASIIPSIYAKALYEAAYFARAQGDFAGARRHLEQSIDSWRTLDLVGKRGLSLAQVLMGSLLRDEGEPDQARILTEKCVAFFREQGDVWNLAWSLMNLGMAIRDQDDYTLAWSTIQESAALWREQGDLWGLSEALHSLALVAYRRGDYEAAYSLTEEMLLINRRLVDKQKIAYSLHNLGVFSLVQGHIAEAKPYFDQDIALFREVGDRSGIVLSLQYQGVFAHLEGDDVQAQSILEQGLRLARDTGPTWISSNYLLWLADLAAEHGQFEQAVRLCSAAKTHLDSTASFWDAFERGYYERIMALASTSLGKDKFALVQAEGNALTMEQAIAYALTRQDNLI